ncbi:MAG: anaerobic ribonucleoside-triphosphate reductase activating protein [Clostridia bacterium]
MKIKGLQKLTLLDYPEKTACTIFTGGCNFRCPFCHNASLVFTRNGEDDIEEEEVLKHLIKRKSVLDGVCITGGEPLLQNDIEEFIKKVKDLGYLVKLDTNGYNPEKLESLLNNNLLDYIAMDIKNSLEKYAITAGINNFDKEKIKRSIALIKNSNIDYEFRTTVVAEFHTVEDFDDIGKIIANAKAYYLQNFVDSGDLIGSNLHAMPKNEMIDAKTRVKRYVNNVEIRGI